MSDDNRTEEEIIADLEARRKGYVFMTTGEAQAWNDIVVKKPTSKNHWSYKVHKIKHVLRMGALWKRFAKVMYADVITIKVRFKDMVAEIEEKDKYIADLLRMMHSCDKCKAAPGEECKFICTRDGSRDSK